MCMRLPLEITKEKLELLSDAEFLHLSRLVDEIKEDRAVRPKPTKGRIFPKKPIGCVRKTAAR